MAPGLAAQRPAELCLLELRPVFDRRAADEASVGEALNREDPVAAPLPFVGVVTQALLGGGPVEGWFNTRIYLETKDEKLAQGWTTFVMDTNGNGRRDAYVEPDQPVDPTKDKRVVTAFYGVEPAPDGSV